MKVTYAVVVVRILLTPLFFYAFTSGFSETAVLLLIAVFLSDIVDGRLAEREGITIRSTPEAYLDPIADFLFVLVSYYALILREVFPAWILALFVFMFLFFVISSKSREPLYDPLGKYYGVFLMAAVGITLIFPANPVPESVLILIIGYTLALIVYRTRFLWKIHLKA